MVLSVQPQLVSYPRSSPFRGISSCHKGLPLGQGDRTAGLVGLAVDQVAFEVKVVVDVGVDRGELL